MSRDLAAGIRALLEDYIGRLDRRDFAGWLELFAPDGYYAVLRNIEYEAGNNVLLVGEDMRRLRARIEFRDHAGHAPHDPLHRLGGRPGR